jgi:putative ABC transport system permease protein
MDNIQTIPLFNLGLVFLPVMFVVWILHRWSLESGVATYSLARMLAQLLLIGYLLAWIFSAEQWWLVLAVLAVMLLAASWIALRPLRRRGRRTWVRALAAIALGGVTTLALVTGAVLDLDPWFAPHMMIPLAGMIFSNAMNAVSIAAERFASEVDGVGYVDARHRAMRAAMIPLINSMFAVGLVALPGMMTGQILAGVSPLIAVRYQIMVMCMIFGSAGIAAAWYLWSLRGDGR